MSKHEVNINVLLRQHNAITQARYEMSTLEKNIIYMLLCKLSNRDAPDKIYTIKVKEIESISKKELQYSEVKAATRSIISRVCELKQPDGKLLHAAMISSATYLDGSGLVEVGIDPRMRPYLFDLKNHFTTFKLRDALVLRSKYSKRIYEMLNQFTDTGYMKLTIQELKYRLKLIDLEEKKEYYPKFGLFKKAVLDVAEREICNLTDIHFAYVVKKSGKRYTDLEFKITKKGHYEVPTVTYNLLDSEKEAKIKRVSEDLLTRFRLSDWQVKKIFDNVDLDKICKTKYDIQGELINGKLRNVGAYTAKVFDQKYNLGLFVK